MFAAGEAPPSLVSILGPRLLEYAEVVCADGGLAHCLDAGMTPDCLIGDFDSADQALLNDSALEQVKRIGHPADKNASDLELALEYLASGPAVPDVVIVLGVSGGRTDHHLFNWLLTMARPWPFGLRLIDKTVDAYLVTSERPCELQCIVGTIVSLVPLGDALGVCTRGLRYALQDDALQAGRTLGLSNVAISSEVCVAVGEGKLLAMRVLA